MPLICIRELFAAHQIRCTRQRAAVYEALRDCHSHPTAEALFKLVQPQLDGISLATVYNTLEALCRVGLVRKLPTESGCCRYEADTDDHLHIRFADSSEIADVPHHLGSQLLENLPKDVIDRIEREMGVKIEGVAIQLIARGSAPKSRHGWSDSACRESA